VAGVRSGRLQDASRMNWSGDAPRPVEWVTWYPLATRDDELAPSLDARANDSFALGPLVSDGALSAGASQYPVVLLSHGTGGCAWSLSWLGWRLAQAGYITIGVSHHGNTTLEPYRPEGFLCWWERATDLTFVLDHLSVDGPLAGRLDLDRAFAFGFSLGGYTVMSLLGAITNTALFRAWGAGGSRLAIGPKEFPDLAGRIEPLLRSNPVFRSSWERQRRSHRDARIRAAFLAAPAPTVRSFEVESVRAIQTPVEMIVGGGDEEAPPDACARWLHDHLPNCTLDVLAREVGHYVFLCEGTERGKAMAPDLLTDPFGVDRAAIHRDVSERCVRFFGINSGS
jgi:predicted dienelactone hydrolase